MNSLKNLNFFSKNLFKTSIKNFYYQHSSHGAGEVRIYLIDTYCSKKSYRLCWKKS